MQISLPDADDSGDTHVDSKTSALSLPLMGADKHEMGRCTADGTSQTAETLSSSSGDHDASSSSSSSISLTAPSRVAMEVTVTVLSLHGVVVRSKRKVARKPKNLATIVVSFSKALGANRTVFTEIPSLPLRPAGENTTSDEPIVRWPSASSIQFQQCLDRDGPSGHSYAPVSCPIEVSVSHSGKLTPVGTANLILSGEEAGGTPSVIPIVPNAGGKKDIDASLQVLVKVSEAPTPSIGTEAREAYYEEASEHICEGSLLRKKLAESQSALRELRGELAEAWREAALARESQEYCEAENERLRSQLELAKKNTAMLLNEMAAVGWETN